MIDPNDNSTRDLVEYAQQQKIREQNAKRQRALRARRKAEREEGKRVALEFTAEELMLLGALAGAEAQKMGELHPGSWSDRAHASLWRRLVVAQTGQYPAGDARWSREALETDAGEVREALRQRLTGVAPPAPVAPAEPEGKPLKPWEVERDYRLTDIDVGCLLSCIGDAMTIRPDLYGAEDSTAREVADKLTKGTRFEGVAEQLGKSEGVLNTLKRLEDNAKRGWQAYNDERDNQRKRAEQAGAIEAERLAAQLAPLQRELEAVHREKDLLEVERCSAFAAIKVYEQRLRDAGLSTEYR